MIIELNLPLDAQFVGELHDDYEIDELQEDLLQIALPKGYGIDLGWYPEHDRVNGRFMIVVFKDNWENILIKTYADTPIDAAEVIRRCAMWVAVQLARESESQLVDTGGSSSAQVIVLNLTHQTNNNCNYVTTESLAGVG